MRKTESLLYSFFIKINRTDTCWIWTGAKHEWGYGLLGKGTRDIKKTHKAHRLSWQFFRGPIPQNKYVLHKCDTPSCVNPKHLFLGTLKDNSRDMINKGRGRGQYKKGHKESLIIKRKRSKALLGNQNAKTRS